MANTGAIETRYKGCRFRSRLEARWAVYFDAIGLEWEYEPEGYQLGSHRYLPDFWLPQVLMFAEVKPNTLFDNFETSKDFDDFMWKATKLSVHTGYPIIVLNGMPECTPYTYIYVDYEGKRIVTNDCLLSMYHNYPIDERRFYTNTGYEPSEYKTPRVQEALFGVNGIASDVPAAVEAARSARFEFGESGYKQP